ncbi:MAG: hypothetical protein AAF598_11610 [Bacteroidota bacterium]
MKLFTITCLAVILFLPEMSALNPSRTYRQRPEKYNMKFTEYRVKTQDGDAALNAWYFPAKENTKQLVLISHNGEGNMADYLRRVDQFRQFSNVMIYDYRGYGSSSEFEIDNKRYIYPHFIDDLQSMINFAVETLSPELSLYGWGIGAGLSIGVGHQSRVTKRIIADTPFYSIEDLEERFAGDDNPKKFPGEYDEKYEPSVAINKPPGNKGLSYLLIIGSNDLLFKPEELKEFAAPLKDRVQSIEVIENPDRKDNFRANKAAYIQAIKRFVKAS